VGGRVFVGRGVSVGAEVGVGRGGRVEVGLGVAVGAGGWVGLGGGKGVTVATGGAPPPTPRASFDPLTEAWIAAVIAGPVLDGAFWINPNRTALWWVR
jgi:hypothetical protein